MRRRFLCRIHKRLRMKTSAPKGGRRAPGSKKPEIINFRSKKPCVKNVQPGDFPGGEKGESRACGAICSEALDFVLNYSFKFVQHFNNDNLTKMQHRPPRGSRRVEKGAKNLDIKGFLALLTKKSACANIFATKVLNGQVPLASCALMRRENRNGGVCRRFSGFPGSGFPSDLT